jgi:hypothetical protein
MGVVAGGGRGGAVEEEFLAVEVDDGLVVAGRVVDLADETLAVLVVDVAGDPVGAGELFGDALEPVVGVPLKVLVTPATVRDSIEPFGL